MDNPGGPPARPNLTVTPETPSYPVPTGIPPPPPAEPPPPLPLPVVAEDAGVADAFAPPASPQGEPIAPTGSPEGALPGTPGAPIPGAPGGPIPGQPGAVQEQPGSAVPR
jgi:hypothetical protein